MSRAAAIVGRAVDETGAPVESVRVVARSAESPNVQRSASSDDLGEFRIGGLNEGEFIVEDEAAGVVTRVRVRVGESVDLGDIVIRNRPASRAGVLPNPKGDGAANVSGRVRDTKGRPLLVEVRRIPPESHKQRLRQRQRRPLRAG